MGVGLLIDDALIQIDSTEAAERRHLSLGGIDAVLVNESIHVRIAPMDERYVNRDLALELLPNPGDGLVHERLGHIGVDKDAGIQVRGRGRVDAVIRDAIRVVVVFPPTFTCRGVGAPRDRVTAVHLLVNATEVASKDSPRVVGQEVGEAEPGADCNGIHLLVTDDVVVPAHEVGSQTKVQRQPINRLPGVLNVPGKVTIFVVKACDHIRCVPATVEPGCSHARVGRIEQGVILGVPTRAVRILQVVRVLADRHRVDTELELVRSSEVLNIVRDVTTEHQQRRGA